MFSKRSSLPVRSTHIFISIHLELRVYFMKFNFDRIMFESNRDKSFYRFNRCLATLVLYLFMSEVVLYNLIDPPPPPRQCIKTSILIIQ